MATQALDMLHHTTPQVLQPVTSDTPAPVTEPTDLRRSAIDDRLLAQYQAAEGLERERLKAEIVERHIGLVRFLVRRYASKGESYDDLVQVGMVGLLGAIDRYEPDRGVRFASFARPRRSKASCT